MRTFNLALAVLITGSTIFLPNIVMAENIDWQSIETNARDAFNKGTYGKAEVLYTQAVKEAKSQNADAEALSRCLNGLASAYARLDKTAKAQSLYQESLALLENKLGTANSKLIPTLLDLASIYESQGDHARAEPIYNRVFAISDKTFGPQDIETARNLHQIAAVQTHKAKLSKTNLQETEKLYQRSLSILTKTPVVDQAMTAQCLEDYAKLLTKLNRKVEAESLLEQAKAIRKENLFTKPAMQNKQATELPIVPAPQSSTRNLPPDASTRIDDTGKVGDNSSAWRSAINSSRGIIKQDQLNEATGVLARAQDSGTPPQQLAPMFGTLAEVYYQQSRYGEAEPMYKRMLEIDEQSLGKDHPGYAADLNNLALLYIAQGKCSRAEPLLKQALNIYLNAYGNNNLLVIKCQNDLGKVYECSNNLTAAYQQYYAALQTSKQTLGSNDAQTAQILNELAYVSYLQGSLSQSEDFYKEALASCQAAFGTNNKLTAACMEDYARVLRRLDKNQQAADLETKAKTILQP
jgi:tetratricopeptide (TPR) repeat protein